jgi:hypothetical protein
MTLGVGGYVTELTYDSEELQPSSLDYVLWVIRGLNDIPSVRGTDQVVPTRTGQVERNRKADKLAIELKGYVLANGDDVDATVANFRGSVETLKGLFDPALASRVLAATLEDGSAASINARVVGLAMPEVVPGHVAEVSVSMESLDPYWVITPGGS